MATAISEPTIDPVAVAAPPPARVAEPHTPAAVIPAPPNQVPEEEALPPARQRDVLAPAAHEPARAPMEVALLPEERPERAVPAPPPAQSVASPEAAAAAVAETAASAAERAPAALSDIEVAMLPQWPAAQRPAPKLAAEPTPGPLVYLVQPGDSLRAIAAEFGVTTASLAQANNIADPKSFRPGRKLRIPSTPVYFDGRPLVSDAPTLIANGRANVPLRIVIEEAGGQVAWEGERKRATALARGHTIAVRIGEDQAQLDGKQVGMGAPAALRHSRTVVPLRFLGDALDLILQYEDGIIHIASARN
jgi:hypothetical protein